MPKILVNKYKLTVKYCKEKYFTAKMVVLVWFGLGSVVVPFYIDVCLSRTMGFCVRREMDCYFHVKCETGVILNVGHIPFCHNPPQKKLQNKEFGY